MSDVFLFKVFTPAGLQLEASVTSVNLPSSAGEIGVLPHHTRYTGLVGNGVLEYAAVEGRPRKIVVSGGFCTFTGDVFTVLADSVDLPEKLAGKSYATEKDSLLKVVQSESTHDPKWIVASEQLRRIEAIERLTVN